MQIFLTYIFTMIIRKAYNPNDISQFISNAGASLKTFRYFKTRPVNIIEKHLITLVGVKSGKIIAYGHLDQENGNIWLGICVAESYSGLGFGSQIMQELLKIAYNLSIKTIKLSVDSDNKAAIKFYKKFGFTIIQKNLKNYLMIFSS